ncbi:MAG: DinB family protein [Actinobacteria bacterium]|nr:DinB family protein [Actinomycetota bacterium]
MTWTAPLVTRREFALDLSDRQALEAFISWHRQTLLWKVSGLTGEQLASRPVPTSNLSLLGIVRHMAEVERYWWRQRVAREDVASLYLDDDEWDRMDPERAAEDYQQLLDEWAEVDAVAQTYDLDHTFDRRGETWSIRTLYLHLIEEWARHNGHADLLREAIDGQTGE